MFGKCIVCVVCLMLFTTLVKGETDRAKRLKQLYKHVGQHYEEFKRDIIREIENYSNDASGYQVPMAGTFRQKRNDIEDVISSVHAFCDNFKGRQTQGNAGFAPDPEVLSTKTISTQTETKDTSIDLGHFHNIEVPPVYPSWVKVNKRGNNAIVEVTVKLTEPGYAIQHFTSEDMITSNKQRHLKSSTGVYPSTETVIFDVNTVWCANYNKYRQPHAAFFFSSINDKKPGTGISISVCQNEDPSENISSTVKMGVNFTPHFRNSLADNVVRIVPGRNVSFVLNLYLNQSLHFFGHVISFNGVTYETSQHDFVISRSWDSDQQFDVANTRSSKPIHFVEVKELSNEDDSSRPTMRASNSTSFESDNYRENWEKRGRLLVTLDTESGDDSALVVFTEINEIMGLGDTLISTYVFAMREGQSYPIDTTTFLSQDKLFCDLNVEQRKEQNAGDTCSVLCYVVGNRITRIRLYKTNNRGVKSTQTSLDHTGHFASTALYLGRPRAQDAGVYVCEAEDAFGGVSAFNIELTVGFSGSIDKNNTTILDRGNGIAVVNCASYGQNVTFVIETEDNEGTMVRIDNNANYTLSVVRESARHVTYSLDLPTSALQYPVNSVRCIGQSKYGFVGPESLPTLDIHNYERVPA